MSLWDKYRFNQVGLMQNSKCIKRIRHRTSLLAEVAKLIELKFDKIVIWRLPY